MTEIMRRVVLLVLLTAGSSIAPCAWAKSTPGASDPTMTPFTTLEGVVEDISSKVESLPRANTTALFEDNISNVATESPTTSYHPENISGTVETPAQWSWKGVSWSWNIILQLCLGVLGIGGNFLVIVVLYRRRRVSHSTDILLTALAVADFLTSVFIIPIPEANVVPSSWVGELYCRTVFTNFFLWLSVSGSIFTLTTISIERFIAVVFPFEFNRLLLKRHVVLAILMIWVVSLVADIFIVLTISVDPLKHSCSYGFPSAAAQESAGVISFLLHFVIPAFIMLITQVITVRSLYVQSQRFGSHAKGHSGSTSGLRLLKAKNRVLKLLLVVILIFILCWGPNSIAYFLYNIRAIDSSYLYGDLNRVLTLLAFCNSCANPFIYAIQYPQFRKAIRELFTCSRSPLEAIFESHPSNSKDNGKSTQMTEDVSKI